MARSKETKIELTAYDDLFETDQSREEAKLSKIRDIPISEIDEFPDHPFKVFIDEDMEQLVDTLRIFSLPSGSVCVNTVRTVRVLRRMLTTSYRAIRRGQCLQTPSLLLCSTKRPQTVSSFTS